MAEIDPHIFILKDNLIDLTNGPVEPTQNLRENELDKIAGALTVEQNNTLSEIEKKVQGAGHRFASGIETITTGAGQFFGTKTVSFKTVLPSTNYAVILTTFSSNNDYSYSLKTTSSFRIGITMPENSSETVAWIMVY